MFQHSNMVLLSPNDVLKKGLTFLDVQFERKSDKHNRLVFHKHYGSAPLDLAEMWYDLTVTDIPQAQMDDKEKSEKGFRMFMITHFWLWTYPKNSNLTASRFKSCKRYLRGEPLWKWIKRIAALKAKKIVWNASLDDANTAVFAISIDGTDFKIWERKHPLVNVDRAQWSKKFNHGAAKYQVALSVFGAKCVHIAGPYRGGKHDLEVFRQSGLKEKLAHNKKLALVDRGYRTARQDEQGMFSFPDNVDSKQLNNFKSRGRLRQETFNGRLKFFGCLSNTFRHGFDNHKFVFEAIVVIVQYQMDNGSEIYAV
jgi:hypothetical protein